MNNLQLEIPFVFIPDFPCCLYDLDYICKCPYTPLFCVVNTYRKSCLFKAVPYE